MYFDSRNKGSVLNAFKQIGEKKDTPGDKEKRNKVPQAHRELLQGSIRR